MDILCLAARGPPGCQQAQFRVSSCPVTHTPIHAVRLLVQLNPDEGGGLVGKAPCLHDLPRLAEHGHGDPEEQGAVTGGQLGNRQGLDVLNSHGGIVAFCQSAAAPYPIVPGRVGVNDIVLFPYKPNISFTIRSAPFTSPVRISILKMSCPMYCHAMVTAGRLASTAGLLLERNAE